jgi:hypothetical protein
MMKFYGKTNVTAHVKGTNLTFDSHVHLPALELPLIISSVHVFTERLVLGKDLVFLLLANGYLSQ